MPLPVMHLRNKQAIVKTVNAPNCHCEERSDVAISGRQLRFRRWLSHDSVGSCEIATAPLGPRNDKFGSITRSTRVHTNLQLPMALTARKGHAASVERQSR